MKPFLTAYDTTVCGGYVLDKLETALKTTYIHGDYKRDNGSNIIEIEGMGTTALTVPQFAHPFLLDMNGEKLLAIDVRPFGSYDRMKGAYALRNGVEYALLHRRAQLNDIWINDNPALLRDVSPVAMTVFASWISESVSRRFALDPREQLSLSILSAFHYLSLFTDEAVLDDTLRTKMATQISRGMRIGAEDVFAILDEQSAPSNGIEDFCGTAAEATKSVRLEKFNPGVLISILKGSWFGVNAEEMLAASTEHPPTWLALLMAAHTERTYKNSGLARLVERQAHKDANKQFLRAVLNLTQLARA
ncbi:hypothetical protein [Paraburkholderia sp. BCC1886]|uniref:hypothetical protein n=1 Tax=Paraburkholderia sp. BCC1886 TaxID=2562670 RepID=UPI0011837F79|nr:hypothetical protein [Paraburkholderia sp. BCC1886]